MSVISARVETLWYVAGWTMVHYMWIGGVGLCFTALVRLLVRRAAPNIRYLAMLGCFGLLTVTPLIIAFALSEQHWMQDNLHGIDTLGGAMDQISNANPFGNHDIRIERESLDIEPQIPHDGIPMPEAPSDNLAQESFPPGSGTPLGVTNNSDSRTGINDKPSDWRAIPGNVGASLIGMARATWNSQSQCNSWIGYLPWVWTVGTPLLLVWLATGYMGTGRLRRASRPVESGDFVEALQRTERALRVSSQVGLAVCDRIAAPVLIGIVRPLILLPPAALTGWSPAELEMVLLHELAHVRRWDNPINLVQRLIEAFYFFHPTIWIISMWIRHDRELCCDVVVLKHTSAPAREYAQTLIDLAAATRAAHVPVTGVATAAGNMRRRIRNILKMEDEPMRISMKTLATALFAVLFLGGMMVWCIPHQGLANEKETANVESGVVLSEGEETANTPATDAIAREDLKYDGKTFNKWRDEWRTELKTERRTEAIRALAAFGARGYGKEAAETILEVVKEYDWSQIEGGTPIGNLKNSAVMAFNGRETTSGLGVFEIPIDAWLPVLIQAVHSGDKQIAKFAVYVLQGLDIRHQRAVPQLIEISQDKAFAESEASVLNSLSRIYQSTKEKRIKTWLEEAVRSDHGQIARGALETLYPGSVKGPGGFGGGGFGMGGEAFMPGAPEGISSTESHQVKYTPSLLDALAHKDAAVRNHAIQILINLGPDAAPAVPKLVQMLGSDDEDNFDNAFSILMRLVNHVPFPTDDVLAIARKRMSKNQFELLFLLMEYEKIKPADLIPLIIEAIKNPSVDNRLKISWIKNLGKWGSEAQDAVPALLPLLLVENDWKSDSGLYGEGMGGGRGGYGGRQELPISVVAANALYAITGSHDAAMTYLVKVIAEAESNAEVEQATGMLMRLKNEHDRVDLEGGYGMEGGGFGGLYGGEMGAGRGGMSGGGAYGGRSSHGMPVGGELGGKEGASKNEKENDAKNQEKKE